MSPAISGPTAAAQERARARRRRRSRRVVGAILTLVLLGVVFLAGLAIGRAVEEAPRPGGTQTVVRTLTPLTVEPEERTVTVTTAP
jgi:cobalamin biosynthesis protein CobD/CbiB